jgi:tyrosine-protein phosphatase YwqE
MHSHLIPGIDDGSQNMDQTLIMLAKFESLGYRKVITTPHIISDVYKNDPQIIREGLKKVREAAIEKGLSIQIEAAAEYYFDETLLQKLRTGEELLTFSGKHVLFEFSFHEKPDRIDELLFEFKTRGYQPVLAHFERYLYWIRKPEQARIFREQGVLIQVNLNSLTGHYGPEIRKQAEKLVDMNCIDLVGTDCHRIEHLMILEKNLALPFMHKINQLDLKNSVL